MIICEKILDQQDGVMSAIRIVDVFYVRELPKELSEIENVALVEANISSFREGLPTEPV